MKKNIFTIYLTLLASLLAIAQNSAPSCHLTANDNAQGDIIMKTVRSTITTNTTYYCTMQWNAGMEGGAYCGFQDSPDKGHMYIYSIWDPSNHLPITAKYLGSGTMVESFGGEGTGLKAFNQTIGWTLNQWNTQVTRRWNVNGHTYFGYWIRDITADKWTHMVTMDYPVADIYFQGQTNAFLEDWTSTGANKRRFELKDIFKRTSTGTWIAGDQATFNRNNETRSSNYTNNNDTGVTSGAYFIQSGGITSPSYSGTPPITLRQNQGTAPTNPAIEFSISIATNTIVNWTVPVSSTPQYKYTVLLNGTQVASGIDSEVTSQTISATNGSTIAVTLEDILGRTSTQSYTIPAFGISPQIASNVTEVNCFSLTLVKFSDLAVRTLNTTWAWSFPGGTPSTSSEKFPTISYSGVSVGKYDVILTTTDSEGSFSQYISKMIDVSSCDTTTAEAILGNVANLKGAIGSDYIDIAGLNISNTSMTFSCWIKPTGIQADWSSIFMSQGSGMPFGLNFKNGNNSLGFHPDYSWNSGFIAPANQWSYVALVSNGVTVTVYLNGVASTISRTLTPETLTRFFLGSYGGSYTNRFANLQIDEVCIWNRALTQDEIRKWRHLTKTTNYDPILVGLKAYYQFNETTGSLSTNKVGTNNATYNGSTYSHDASSAPFFGGISEKSNVIINGIVNYPNTGMTINFSEGIIPNGEVWSSKSNALNPDQLPDTYSSFGTYWILDNYGTNQIISTPSNISFLGNVLNTSSSIANTYNLYKRNSNDFGSTWGGILDNGDTRTGAGESATLAFSSGLYLTSLGQLVLSQNIPLGIKSQTLSPSELIWTNGKSLYINSEMYCKVLIYNALGDLVETKKINVPAEFNFNVSGFYIVKVIVNNKVITKKILIN
jgi:hypothetical protein